MKAQKLIQPIPDPCELFEDEGCSYEALAYLLVDYEQFRVLCNQVAQILAHGNKSLRVSLATTLELMESHISDCHRYPPFDVLSDDNEDAQEGYAQ